MNCVNFLNGIKGLEDVTWNMGLLGGTQIPLFFAGHARWSAPHAHFHFTDLTGAMSGIAKVYDIDERYKMLLMGRFEYVKLVIRYFR